MDGKKIKILVSAGPTREYIDPIRYISNPSTGKMGYLIAEYAKKNGFDVILVSGPTHLKPPENVKFIKVETAREMQKEILKYFPKVNFLIMSSAVCDWRPYRRFKKKLKRKKEWNLKLVPNPDILKSVSKIKKENQKVIGFALETDDILKNAEKKLKEKKLDLIIGNTPDFFGDGKKSEIYFIFKNGKIIKRKLTKKQLPSFLFKNLFPILLSS
ncbi:MAG: phosphopantothenoylcysteine decarboxylase [Candidatus Omnitrophica bacterium]|nr:phosphopantothenoylcysteine decarboxylase [Candidatus Omnitrophota bacterium]MCM8807381.1 phosphopantothenoylcysteine decarboxylase [Candidatus Omnitrophota bacterium]